MVRNSVAHRLMLASLFRSKRVRQLLACAASTLRRRSNSESRTGSAAAATRAVFRWLTRSARDNGAPAHSLMDS